MKQIDAAAHVRGESVFVDDVPDVRGTLHVAVLDSVEAHARIVRLDTSRAAAAPGVVAVLTAADVPGENQVGGILPDEPLLAEDEVDFCGQPVALVVAETAEAAHAARALVEVEYEPLEVVTEPREAARRGLLIQPPRHLEAGDVDAAWRACAHVVEGRCRSGGQEHLYLETQCAYALPEEDGRLRVLSSTQGPTAVQRGLARVLGIDMHRIEVDVRRLGGGFGGKEDQATTWAALAALACVRTGRPARLTLDRHDDLRMTGRRHPYEVDFRIGLDAELKVLAFEATYYQDAGAAADLSPAVLERTMLHVTGAYRVPNVRVTLYSCRTNLPPNTAFRGFGGPQGLFAMEAALAEAARHVGVETLELQRRNLLREGDAFPFGQLAEGCNARPSLEALDAWCDLARMREEVRAFNAAHRFHKRGMAVMPICFGISFTKRTLNQAGALVHVYSDGSVAVSTGAVEMGQGVTTKLQQIAARGLGVAPARVRVESANTLRVANTSPTAASSAADLNGMALARACAELRGRLLACAAQQLGAAPGEVDLVDDRVVRNGEGAGLDWPQLVARAYLQRVDLSARAHYATPGLDYDTETQRGRPFAYHVYGAAVLVVKLDCLRGTYVVEQVLAMHDFGESLNPHIDLGQAEGGIVQGLGWMTMEEVVYDPAGRLRSNSLSTYKVPDIHSMPARLEVRFLEGASSDRAIYRSKAIGEPPLLYGIGAYFALRDAVLAFDPEARFPIDAPMTPEKALLALHDRGARA
ncbi:MAG: molybdopterin-dependent oxidoreductase [Planctomycetes bacterium]|nr:molybdopterin-dependent oxidoreductase [Planctomycetota bacterium]